MSDDEPQHQPSWDEDDEEQDLPGTRQLVRSHANIWGSDGFATGGKAPRGGYSGMELGGTEYETPDLGAYFEEWDMEPKDQIIMCRAYASMLSASKKAKKK